MKRYGICAAALIAMIGAGCVDLPQSQTIDRYETLEQNWTADERQFFYHRSQGSVLMPYAWFEALEQPEIKFVGEVGMFNDPEYLSRFGLLPNPGNPSCSPDFAGFPESDGDTYLPLDSCGAPVGFARACVTLPGTADDETEGAAPWDAQCVGTGYKRDMLGLTCAACHTAELHYQGQAIRIDGGSQLIDVTQFQTALKFATLLADRLPFRFNRFANRVLGEDDGSDEYAADRDRLRSDLKVIIDEGLEETRVETSIDAYAPYPGGYGRTDALARIGNGVFSVALGNPDNMVVGNAPVKFPHIWDVPWYSWAQYNGSIEAAMVRNAGEALGVKARLGVYADPANSKGSELYGRMESTIDFEGLHQIEQLLAGVQEDPANPTPLGGLQSPVWPESLLGPIEWGRVARGEELYRNVCQVCHLPPLHELVVTRDGDGPPEPGQPLKPNPAWNGAGGGYGDMWISSADPEMVGDLTVPAITTEFVAVEWVNLGSVGTDPGQALNFLGRTATTWPLLLPSLVRLRYTGPPDGPLAREPFPPTEDERITYDAYPAWILPAGVGLQRVTVGLAEQYYDEMGFTDVERAERDGYRAAGALAYASYRPRPLNGIWASPPYLHNGSVHSLYQLLSPAEERDKTFWTGNREYDPVHVGYESGRFRGGFQYDTTVDGNSNLGHEFANKPMGNGVIGPFLTEDDRFAIIEYLKAMCPANDADCHGRAAGAGS